MCLAGNVIVNVIVSMVSYLHVVVVCIGGGKDEVLKYLNESQKQVIQAKASLEKIMDALEIKP